MTQMLHSSVPKTATSDRMTLRNKSNACLMQKNKIPKMHLRVLIVFEHLQRALESQFLCMLQFMYISMFLKFSLINSQQLPHLDVLRYVAIFKEHLPYSVLFGRIQRYHRRAYETTNGITFENISR